jgi:diguanylate cyclase (GGDEF)-like protein
MQPCPKPENEEQRLHSLRALDILDTSPEERFDRLTRLARRVCRTPIAVVSLVDEHRQWFKSIVGLDAQETPRDISFCGHAILGHGIMRVDNALEDPRFSKNPLVLEEPSIRAYAGAPLRLPNGAALGTLCVIDTKVRQFSDDELSALEDLARLVENELLAVEMASLDELTMLPNRRGFQLLANYAIDRSHRSEEPLCAVMIDIDDFKLINDRYGHEMGDRVLKEFSATLRGAFRKTDVMARLGGDEFVILAQGHRQRVVELVDRFSLRSRENISALRLSFFVHYSVGVAEYDRQRHSGLAALLSEADTLMYQGKSTRRATGA